MPPIKQNIKYSTICFYLHRMFEQSKKYFSYLLNPLELLRTKKVLQVNPTIAAPRQEPDEIKIFVYDYNAAQAEVKRT